MQRGRTVGKDLLHPFNTKRKNFVLLPILLMLIVISMIMFPLIDVQAQSTSYARVGAYALYDVQGGAVAFFSGIEGNISYTITNVLSNGTMMVRQVINITEGDEVQPSYQVFNYTDSLEAPKVFPIVPNSKLGSTAITFENTSLTFVKSGQEIVGAGRFQTLEYQGVSNGTSVNFYFDSATGLAIYELSGTGSVISLVSSNIATPLSVQDPASQDIPYILLFVIIFAASGVGYYEVSRYYSKRARKDFKKKWKKERMKEKGFNDKPQ